MAFYRQVSGRDLRKLADQAWAAGQKQLSDALHDLARQREAIERAQCAA